MVTLIAAIIPDEISLLKEINKSLDYLAGTYNSVQYYFLSTNFKDHPKDCFNLAITINLQCYLGTESHGVYHNLVLQKS